MPDGSFTPGFIDTSKEWEILQVPHNLSGQRILDIGCSDGYYSFRSEKQGAREVIAIDDQSSLLWNNGSGIEIVSKIFESKIRFYPKSVYDLDVQVDGLFDQVFFLNVMYHLKHPLFGLEKIRSVMQAGATLMYKSYFTTNFQIKLFGKVFRRQFGNKPIAHYYPNNELAGDFTNWWGPNIPGHIAMLKSCGFKVQKELYRSFDRIYLKCIAV